MLATVEGGVPLGNGHAEIVVGALSIRDHTREEVDCRFIQLHTTGRNWGEGHDGIDPICHTNHRPMHDHAGHGVPHKVESVAPQVFGQGKDIVGRLLP